MTYIGWRGIDKALGICYAVGSTLIGGYDDTPIERPMVFRLRGDLGLLQSSPSGRQAHLDSLNPVAPGEARPAEAGFLLPTE